MPRIALGWEDWGTVIAVLQAKVLPSTLEHANCIEQHLEPHAPDEAPPD